MRSSHHQVVSIALIAVSAVVLAGCQQFLNSLTGQTDQAETQQEDADQADSEQAQEGEVFLNSIVAVAANADQLRTFASALDAAGLLETFSGEGPFTVFAPSNEAFEALPAGTMTDLLANPAELAELLRYHVVSGSLSASQAAELSSAVTLQGGEIEIATSENGEVTINGASITTPDLTADNGVIHVIDAVLTVPEGAGEADEADDDKAETAEEPAEATGSAE